MTEQTPRGETARMAPEPQVARLLERGSDNDRAFFDRVFATPAEIYERRLVGVGMSGHDHVVDAGCGFGQWTMVLAALNRKVTAIDVAPLRTDVVRALARE